MIQILDLDSEWLSVMSGRSFSMVLKRGGLKLSIRKIEAFKMWVLRRLPKISWTEHVRNDDVLRMAQMEDRELFEHVKQKKSYLEHIVCGKRYNLQRLILQGKIEGGKRGIGRKRLSWSKTFAIGLESMTFSLFKRLQWIGVFDKKTEDAYAGISTAI